MERIEDQYIEVNKKLWNKRTEVHIKSKFYDVEGFNSGKNMLKPIEIDLLGDVKGKTILHLQCHFGLDTLSLARMGAITTGVDFSEKAIEEAIKLAFQNKLEARFICCDIFELDEKLDEKFDIVFTSYGTIGWLPDINRWAEIVSKYLKPNGKFVFAEFHPIVWMFDNDFNKVAYNYAKSEAIIEVEENTYGDKNAVINQESVGWNHGLAEVIGSLLKHNLKLLSFKEYHHSPYDVFSNMVKIDDDTYIIEKFGNKIPLVYSLVMEK